MTALRQAGAFVLLLCAAGPAAAADGHRVVSLGGAVTEIVYALGEEGRLVARDTTSSFPPEAQGLPDVGYVRQLSPEGVLSVAPDLILAEEGAGPPETMALLRAAAVPVVEVPAGFDAAAVEAKIRIVASALGVPERGEALAGRVGDEIAGATAGAGSTPPQRVLFVLSLQGGRVMAAGSGTAADGIIRLAGAENALSGIAGYKPVTDEAVIAAAPDVILMMANAGPGVADDAVFSHPAIHATPAGAARRLVRMDGLLLVGFGPRTAEAVSTLAAALAVEGKP